MNQETESRMLRLMPYIPWLEPLRIARSDGASGFGCRFCIANNGFVACDVESLPPTPEAFEEHMRKVHNRQAVFTV